MNRPSPHPAKARARRAHPQIIVGVADMAVSNDPKATIVTYSLGSCLGLAVYDPDARVGGILHAMLPTFGHDSEKARRTPCRFVDSGVAALFRAAYKLGGAKNRMIVKAAGGAVMLDQVEYFEIGRRNCEVLMEMLRRNGVALAARAVGGNTSRTMRLNVGTGTLTISTNGEPPFEL